MNSQSDQIPAGYKQTDVGVIPEEWEVKELRDVCAYQNGKALESLFNDQDGYIVISIGNYSPEGSFVSTQTYIDRKYKSAIEKYLLKSGDLAMILNDKTSLGTILGRTLLISKNDEFVFNQRTMRIRSKSVQPEYLHHLINSDLIHKVIVGKSMPGTQIYINTSDVLGLELPLPVNSVERDKITEVVRDIDSLISKLDKLIQKKKNIKQGAMQELLTGKRRLPGFSGVWEDTTLEELERAGRARLFRGKVISKKDIDQFPGSYPIYSSSINNNGKFGQYGKHMFNEELITWSVDGGGNFFYRPKHKFSVTNVCGYIRLTTSSIRYDFLAFQLQQLHSYLSFDYTMKAHPSVIRKAYSLKLPSVEEQAAIAQILLEMGVEIEALEVQKTKYINLKQGMMQQLLTGKIRLI